MELGVGAEMVVDDGVVMVLLGGFGRMREMICEVLRIWRMSLKDGATKRRDEMARMASWWRKASSRASGVKNMPTVGTSMLNFERGLGRS